MIVLTMTTCKRLALFLITVRTLLEHCKECRNIPWIIVDDGSSLADQEQMKEATAGLNVTFVWKQDPGHDKSMNLIQEMTRPYEHVFHIEDDWEFFRDFSLQVMQNGLDLDPRVAQVMVNQDYHEGPAETRTIVGSVPYKGFRLHIWDPLHTICKHGEASNGHWPHYSLRPSLIRRATWTYLGPFQVGHREFEREYGVRFMDAGFRTIMLPGVYCKHIGKLSWQTETENQSAYTLNNVSRFYFFARFVLGSSHSNIKEMCVVIFTA